MLKQDYITALYKQMQKFQVGGVLYNKRVKELNPNTTIDEEEDDYVSDYIPSIRRPIEGIVFEDLKSEEEVVTNDNSKEAQNNDIDQTATQDIAQTPVEQPVETNVEQEDTKLSSRDENEQAWNEVYEQYGHLLGLKDEEAYVYLLGQIKHESGNFQYMEGLNTGEEYEGRSDLGNTQKGDGKRFKERGPIQVTGRANYEKIYKEFFIPNGLGEYDIVKNPELGSNPTIGALMSMGWLLTTDSGDRAIRASNRHNVKDLTKAINGGYNGLASRIQITEELLNNYKNS